MLHPAILRRRRGTGSLAFALTVNGQSLAVNGQLITIK